MQSHSEKTKRAIQAKDILMRLLIPNEVTVFAGVMGKTEAFGETGVVW